MGNAAFELLDSILRRCSAELSEEIVGTMFFVMLPKVGSRTFSPELSNDEIIATFKAMSVAGISESFLVASLLVAVDGGIRDGAERNLDEPQRQLDQARDGYLPARLLTPGADVEELRRRYIHMLEGQLDNHISSRDADQKLLSEWRQILGDFAGKDLYRLWNDLIAKDKYSGRQRMKDKDLDTHGEKHID